MAGPSIKSNDLSYHARGQLKFTALAWNLWIAIPFGSLQFTYETIFAICSAVTERRCN